MNCCFVWARSGARSAGACWKGSHFSPLKITVVHQYYLSTGEPGGSRFNEMARVWSRAGHTVTVLAGSINYATGRGSVGPWLARREMDGAIEVWRCRVPSAYSHSYGGRMLAFAVFTATACWAAMRSRRADVVIASSPPLLVALPGRLKALLSGAGTPWIFEVRDLWPESAVSTGVLRKDALLTRALYAIEAWAYRSATRINALTPAFQDDIVDRGLAGKDKIVFVPNGVDLTRFTPGEADPRVRSELGWTGHFVALYAGAHGRANDLDQLLRGAELLRDRPNILIALVGDGPERLRLAGEVARLGLSNVRVHGPMAKERMPEIVRAADVGVAVLQNNPTFRTVYPNKVFDYMGTARPVIVAIDGVARGLVCTTAQAGVYAPPGDAHAMANAIRGLADDPDRAGEMGLRGRAWVAENASRDVLAARYLSLMENLVRSR